VDGRVVSSDVVRTHNIGVFVGFSRIFLLEILIFKGFTARRLYKSFGVKGLMVTIHTTRFNIQKVTFRLQAVLCNFCGSQNKQRLFPYT
jgi:hypothetical protein